MLVGQAHKATTNIYYVYKSRNDKNTVDYIWIAQLPICLLTASKQRLLVISFKFSPDRSFYCAQTRIIWNAN